MKFVHVNLASVAWWFAVSAATTLGGTWDLRANPKEVEVVLLSGQQVSGVLSRDWFGDQWFGINRDGDQIAFAKHAQMSFKKPLEQTGFADKWRSIGPVVFVSAVFGAVLLGIFLPRTEKRK